MISTDYKPESCSLFYRDLSRSMDGSFLQNELNSPVYERTTSPLAEIRVVLQAARDLFRINQLEIAPVPCLYNSLQSISRAAISGHHWLRISHPNLVHNEPPEARVAECTHLSHLKSILHSLIVDPFRCESVPVSLQKLHKLKSRIVL